MTSSPLSSCIKNILIGLIVMVGVAAFAKSLYASEHAGSPAELRQGVSSVDTDGDGIDDVADNCIQISNFMQRDTDGDGFGNFCDPDLDNNGVVNFLDVALWVPSFSTVNTGDEDFNGDGLSNFSDFALFANYYLQSPGPSGLDAITLQIDPPAISDELDLNTGYPVTVMVRNNATPVAGESITLTTTRGTLGATNVVTDPNGEAVTTLNAAHSGVVFVTASSTSGLSATIDGEFVAQNPASLRLEVEPRAIGQAADSELTAFVKDAIGNPVKNASVMFSLGGTLGGTLSTTTAVTDSFGHAQVTYTSPATVTGTNSQLITAQVIGEPLSANRTVTVVEPSLNLLISPAASASVPNPAQRQLSVTISATASDGRSVSGIEASVRTLSAKFFKGYWCASTITNTWIRVVADQCDDEDANENGMMDAGEDFNGNGRIEAGSIATILPGLFVFGGTGVQQVDLFYPKDYVAMLEIDIEVSATMDGVEFVKRERLLLPAAPGDLTDIGVAPPGLLTAPTNFVQQPVDCQIAVPTVIYSSAFGYNANCAVWDFPF